MDEMLSFASPPVAGSNARDGPQWLALKWSALAAGWCRAGMPNGVAYAEKFCKTRKLLRIPVAVAGRQMA